MTEAVVPSFETVELSRDDRTLVITLNRPDNLNAINLKLHDELADVFHFAARDKDSDFVVLTGAGKAFSAGGDLDHLLRNASNPEVFDEEVRMAKRIVFAMLEVDKPLICKMNGHAVGLGATLGLFCDVVFASERAKIGDPHVAVGLVAGDGGAVIWPQLVGLARAKEYLLSGELLSAEKAEEIGLINHCLPLDQLDEAVQGYINKLKGNSRNAMRFTKILLNQELKRVTHSLLDTGLAYETVTVWQDDHRNAVKAMQEKAQG